MISYLTTRMKSDEGATAVEYGLLVALIAAAIITVVGLLSGQVQAAFQAVTDAIETALAG